MTTNPNPDPADRTRDVDPDLDDPVSPEEHPGMGVPTNDDDDLAGADVTGSGVSSVQPGDRPG